MSRRGPRPIEYVCCAVIDGKLTSKSIEASSSEEAILFFNKEFNVNPENIHGPFLRKRVGILDSTKNIEFSGTNKKAVYKGWVVTAALLNQPINSAYLFFERRLDGKKIPKPTGTFIIKLEELKELQ